MAVVLALVFGAFATYSQTESNTADIAGVEEEVKKVGEAVEKNRDAIEAIARENVGFAKDIEHIRESQQKQLDAILKAVQK